MEEVVPIPLVVDGVFILGSSRDRPQSTEKVKYPRRSHMAHHNRDEGRRVIMEKLWIERVNRVKFWTNYWEVVNGGYLCFFLAIWKNCAHLDTSRSDNL